MMRFFKHFPEQSICPICKTNKDTECFLMPIDGTQEDNNCEAQPTHKHCVDSIHEKLRWNREVNIIYIEKCHD
jgi:hypothetical protein